MDVDALEEEVNEWVADGIITEQQASDILSRYEPEQSGRSRAVLALSIVGAALVFVGITSFLATNWERLPRLARAAVLVAGPGAGYAGGVVSYRRGAPRIGHALVVVGALLVGPSIVLFDDLLALGLADAWLLLAWMAVALPTGHALGSRVGTGLGLLVLVALTAELIEPADPVPGIGLLGIALVSIGAARDDRVGVAYRTLGAAVTLGALVVVTTLEGRVAWFDLEPTAGLVAVLAAAIAGVGWRWRTHDRLACGWMGLALAALALSTITVTLAPETVPELAAFTVAHLTTLVAVAATGYYGYRTHSRSFIDLATLGALAQTLSFVTATIIDALSGSVALVVAGFFLLTIGVGLERGRRSLLERF